jgi:hypothetical protein
VVSARANRRGKASLGCLVSLAIFAGALYYGVNIGALWFRYAQFHDEMKTQARLSAALDDETIRRRLQHKADQLGLPDSVAGRIVIRRTENPRQISIETRYSESVDLPLFKRTFVFAPKATQPL